VSGDRPGGDSVYYVTRRRLLKHNLVYDVLEYITNGTSHRSSPLGGEDEGIIEMPDSDLAEDPCSE
jgi:hypothetical protein